VAHPPPRPVPAWKTGLDIEAQSADFYQDYYNAPLLEMIEAAPRRVLDLGCAGGKFGAMLKERFPGATVVGIDANRAAAARAATRIDQAICASLDDIDFAAHGLRHGEFDAAIAADVLEHLVNPWRLLERLKPFLTPDARLLASIPNVRNVGLVSELLQGGRWEYRERGLLDVTHLRFFTLAEIARMFEETGFKGDGFVVNITPALETFYRQHEGKGTVTLKIGRLSLAEVSQRELTELCAEQFLVRVRPA
jgi:2-polyprenyl-3-methyl-5-hydroxy-6-metoxy-1,4-benzoquinol methylase